MARKPPKRAKRPPGRTLTPPRHPSRSQAFPGAPRPGNRGTSRGSSRTANRSTSGKLPKRRPGFAFFASEVFCIGCGCTGDEACVSDLGPCHWVALKRPRGICSVCAARMCSALLANVHCLDADSQHRLRRSGDTPMFGGAAEPRRRPSIA